MKHKFILKLISATIILSIAASLQCCAEKDKQIILTNNMKEDIISGEDQILDLIHKGNINLNNNEFDEARECYEKAISMDKTNKSTYLKIKNNYVNAKRFDDAYYIIKLAIDNNVSRDSMDGLLKDIKSNFPTTLMAASIYKGESYTLPSKVTIDINKTDTQVPVRWENAKVDTSTVGNFKFEGYSDQYGRTVNLSLNISEPVPKTNKSTSNDTAKPYEDEEKQAKPVTSSVTGYIKDIYNQFNNTYLIFDEIEFFDTPDEAKRESKKDHAEASENDCGNDYYYRNTSQDTKVYKFSPNVTISLCDYIINPKENSIALTQVSIDTFKNNLDKFRLIGSNGLLFKITISNNIILDISMIFIP